MAATTSRNIASEIAFLTPALKALSLAASVERLAERARAESWTHEEFLAACLHHEVAAREAHGGEGRIRAARFPARKSLEEFDFDHQRSLNARPSRTWAGGVALSVRQARRMPVATDQMARASSVNATAGRVAAGASRARS